MLNADAKQILEWLKALEDLQALLNTRVCVLGGHFSREVPELVTLADDLRDEVTRHLSEINIQLDTTPRKK